MKSKFHSIPLAKNLCLDIEGGNCCENTRIIPWQCHKGSNQKFAHNSRKQLVAKSSGKCVDIRKGRLVQRTCRKNTAKWVKRNKKWYSLKNRKPLQKYIRNGSK